MEFWLFYEMEKLLLHAPKGSREDTTFSMANDFCVLFIHLTLQIFFEFFLYITQQCSLPATEAAFSALETEWRNLLCSRGAMFLAKKG
jgi:hypothetical protein